MTVACNLRVVAVSAVNIRANTLMAEERHVE
jgi:hypothetical protein